MAIFGKCCCCDLKTGNLVLGVLCLIGAIFGVGNSIKEIKNANTAIDTVDAVLSGLSESEVNEVFAQTPQFNSREEMYNASKLVLVSSAIHLVMSIIYIPASICLIAGAQKSNRKLVGVFLVVDGINIVISFLQILILSVMFGFDIFVVISCVIIIAFLIFIWLFPFSLYQTLQASGSHDGGGQVHYSGGAGSPAGGQVHYPAQTQAYVPVPMSVAYPAQGQQQKY